LGQVCQNLLCQGKMYFLTPPPPGSFKWGWGIPQLKKWFIMSVPFPAAM
jgi:hypothetical protein